MTWSLLTTRLVVARPTAAPPTRKKTSCSEVGFAACEAEDPAGPTSIRVGEFVVPASKRMPATLTPSTSATVMAVTPLSGTNVARPRPRTTVSGRVTLRVWSRW